MACTGPYRKCSKTLGASVPQDAPLQARQQTGSAVHPQAIRRRRKKVGIISPDLEAGQFFAKAMQLGCEVLQVEIPPRVVGGNQRSTNPEVARSLARGMRAAILNDGYDNLTIACNTLTAGWYEEARKILADESPGILDGVEFVSTVDAMKGKFEDTPRPERPCWFGTEVISKMPEVNRDFPVPTEYDPGLQDAAQKCIWTVKAQGGADISGAAGNVVTGDAEAQKFYEEFALKVIEALPADESGQVHITLVV